MKAKVQPEDIVIVFHPEKRKCVLGRVLDIETDGGIGYNIEIADVSAAYDSTREIFYAPQSSVYTVLGDSPPCYGKVFGVEVRPFFDRQTVKGWGDIIWLYPREDLISDGAGKTLRQFAGFIKDEKYAPIAYETHMPQMDPNSLMRGLYHYSPKKENDQIVLLTDKDRPLTTHIIAHEYGHGLWFRVMSVERQAQWIEMYHKYVNISDTRENVVQSVLADVGLLSGKNAIRELFKAYKSDEQDIHMDVLRHVLKEILSENRLSRKDLDILLASGRSVEKYLPSMRRMRKGLAATPVTPYANKSSSEFWCESFAMYCAENIDGRKDDSLDDDIYAMVQDTALTLQASRA